MKKLSFRFFALALFLVSANIGLQSLAQNVKTLVVPEKIAFSKDCRVNDKVRNQCQLEEKTMRFLKEFNRSDYNMVTEKPASGDYHVLSAEIIEVTGAGGGAWSGAKSLKVKGTLKDSKGKVLGSFEAGRYSGGGAFAGYKGTCSIMGRCTKAIGKDIGLWLTNPGMDSYLGDH